MKIKKLIIALVLPLTLLCSCMNELSSSSNNISSSFEQEANNASFKALSITVESGQKFNYYLYTPENVTSNMPLILYLHGGSGKPNNEEGDLNLLMDEDGLPKFVKVGQVSPNSYVLFPQLPYGENGWSDVKNDLYSFLNG